MEARAKPCGGVVGREGIWWIVFGVMQFAIEENLCHDVAGIGYVSDDAPI